MKFLPRFSVLLAMTILLSIVVTGTLAHAFQLDCCHRCDTIPQDQPCSQKAKDCLALACLHRLPAGTHAIPFDFRIKEDMAGRKSAYWNKPRAFSGISVSPPYTPPIA